MDLQSASERLRREMTGRIELTIDAQWAISVIAYVFSYLHPHKLFSEIKSKKIATRYGV